MQIVPRLINKFIPNSYQLSLKLDRTERKFSGTVTITGMVQKNDKSISLHSKQLAIETVLVDGKKAEYSLKGNDELLIEHPDIVAGNHIVVVGFSGKITDSMHGMYPCYFEHDGVKKELLATQFESHHAREVFPCVDEPEAKATFDVTLTTEENVTVLGNMPTKDQRIEDGLLVTTFEITPTMSVYLLAWVVGELQKKSAKTKNGIKINIWSTPAHSLESLDFALDIAVRSTDFFDEYFDTPYPLPKCDHVAVPDFSSGAMENWGLITYREICLLADPSTASITTKRNIAIIIAHEISHQWFGNLVTMKWWDDLWLNESFATLIEYVAVDALEPNWEVWFDFATYNCIAALKRDSLGGVQPVRVDVNHPDEITMLFDGAIVYAKGARVLQMMEHYIGDQAFRSGLKEYFKQFAYQNTQSDDLWTALGKTSHKNIREFMDKWLDQPGYPVLHVSKEGSKVSLTQERLACKSSTKSDSLWPIPLNSNCPDMPEIFEIKHIEITTSFSNPIRFNVNNYGHYVTHYDTKMLEQIVDELKSGKLSQIDRLQLLNEQLILASVGIVSNSDLILLLDAYKNETSEPVWNIISMTIAGLKKFVENDEVVEKKLKQLAGRLAQSEYQRLGWEPKENEPETDSKLRGIIISLMLFSESQQAIDKAKSLFNSCTLEQLNPELRSLILSTVVRYSTDKTLINSLLDTYKSTISSELGSDICAGLTSTRDEATTENLIYKIQDSSTVRAQDVFRWVYFLMRNKYSRDQTWQWMRNNWDWINKTFGHDKSFDDYPMSAAATLNTRKQLEEYKSFFTPLLKIPALTRVINIGINEISVRVDLIEQDGDKVRQTLLYL